MGILKIINKKKCNTSNIEKYYLSPAVQHRGVNIDAGGDEEFLMSYLYKIHNIDDHNKLNGFKNADTGEIVPKDYTPITTKNKLTDGFFYIEKYSALFKDGTESNIAPVINVLMTPSKPYFKEATYHNVYDCGENVLFKGFREFIDNETMYQGDGTDKIKFSVIDLENMTISKNIETDVEYSYGELFREDITLTPINNNKQASITGHFEITTQLGAKSDLTYFAFTIRPCED